MRRHEPARDHQDFPRARRRFEVAATEHVIDLGGLDEVAQRSLHRLGGPQHAAQLRVRAHLLGDEVGVERVAAQITSASSSSGCACAGSSTVVAVAPTDANSRATFRPTSLLRSRMTTCMPQRPTIALWIRRPNLCRETDFSGSRNDRGQANDGWRVASVREVRGTSQKRATILAREGAFGRGAVRRRSTGHGGACGSTLRRRSSIRPSRRRNRVRTSRSSS